MSEDFEEIEYFLENEEMMDIETFKELHNKYSFIEGSIYSKRHDIFDLDGEFIDLNFLYKNDLNYFTSIL